MSKTLEYKDRLGQWRLTHKAANGNITLASTEGYKNKKDMQESMINACKEVLEFYGEKLEYEDTINKIVDLLLEKKEGTSRKEMNEQIKTGVNNGCSPEAQLKLVKLSLNLI